MQVSFIIPLYNGLALTQVCLRTLQATIPPGLEHEIILVDDGSSDGTREWLATLRSPCRVLLNEQNRGFAGTCNHGARAAQGSVLFFLNNDLELLPGWFEPMLAAWRRLGARAGLIGNLQHRVDNGTLDHAGITVSRTAKLEHIRQLPAGARGLRSAFAVTAACCAIDREAFLSAEGFDEGYRNGAEDVDLALKLGRQGRASFVVLDSTVRHHVSAARGPTSQRDEANSRRLFQRWPVELTAAIARAWAAAPPAVPDQPDWRERLADRLHLAGLRREPSRRARLWARWTVGREQARWAALFDPPAVEPTPRLIGETAGFQFDTIHPQAWIKDRATFTLPPGFPGRNLFVNGHLHAETADQPEAVGPLGLRFRVNGVQVRELFPLPTGNFNFGFDSPLSLPDEPTQVELTLLGAERTNRLAFWGKLIAGWPLPRRWKDALGIHRARSLNRRLRLAQVVGDEQVVVTFAGGLHPGAK
jgi:O-antigen biosynthesis protein